jgi:O-antigen/teichoic acid export membrane protein
VVDQVLSSGAQFLLIVLVARQADAATFGAVSVALLVHGFLLGVVRAGIAEVVLLRCRADPAAWRTAGSMGLSLTLLAGAAAGAGALGVGVAIGGEVGHYLLLVALAAAPVYTQDVLRYVAYGTGRVEQAIAIDAVWLGVQVLASAALVIAGQNTPTWLIVAWVVGAVAGGMAGMVRLGLRPRAAPVGLWWAEERSRAAGFVTDFLVSTGATQASFILLSVMLPLEDFAALRLAIVSLSPLGSLLAGVRALTLAHLAGLSTDRGRARRRAAEVASGFAGAAAAYGIGLVLLPDRWGAELFGETWARAATLVGLFAIAEMLRLGSFAAVDLVKVSGTSMELVRTRLMCTVVGVAGLLLGATIAGPRGAAIASAVSALMLTIAWWHKAWSVGATRRRDARPSPPGRTVHLPAGEASASSR